MLQRCSHEDEIRQLTAQGRWPAASTEELRAHAADCRVCGDLVLVVEAFQKARAATLGLARPVPASVLWWRAQLRQRTEAVERLGRPIFGAQVFALVMLLLLGTGMAVWQARDGVAWLTWLEQAPQAALHLDTLWAAALNGSGWNWMVLLPATALVALLSGVVVYLALGEQ